MGLLNKDQPVNTAEVGEPTIVIRIKGGAQIFYTFTEAKNLYHSLKNALDLFIETYMSEEDVDEPENP